MSLPLIVQLSLTSCLVFLQSKAEEEARRAELARHVSDAVNALYKEVYVVVKAGFQVIDGQEYDESAVLFEQVTKKFQQLQDMVKEDPQELEAVNKAYDSTQGVLKLIDSAKSARQTGELRAGSQTKKDLLRQLRSFAHKLEPLVMLERSKKQLLDKSPLRQARVRSQVKNIVIGSTVLNLLFLLALGWFFSRYIVRGLTIMIDNSNRLAAEKSLNPPMPGNDEIALLDGSFHRMAEALQEASRKQRALIENARDVICSLNGEGAFVAVSSAASTVFGSSPENLVSSKMIDLVFPEEQTQTLDELKLIMEKGERPPFETRILRKDGSMVDILWSAIWSKSEGIMFCVAHDITERKAAERLRQEVVQMVSHDLRSPLSVLKAFHDMLEAGILGELNEKGAQLLTLADRTTARMLALVNDLLDIEKMEAGMLQLERSHVELSTVFEQSMQGVQSEADQREVRLEMMPTGATVYGDQHRLVQVLINLLSNAVKFSAPGGKVTLSAIETSGLLEIKVSDQGRGIPAHLLEAIFDRFKQVEQADSKEKGGSGLGLAICKALVELHGGRIRAESEVGKGCTFTINLPSFSAPASGAESDDLP